MIEGVYKDTIYDTLWESLDSSSGFFGVDWATSPDAPQIASSWIKYRLQQSSFTRHILPPSESSNDNAT